MQDKAKTDMVMYTHRVAAWCKGDGLHVMVGYDLLGEQVN